ncbi:hypothetical protein ABH935_007063 [Catenulispora sp. GAS73]|uniref:hypothetical protein n=1 Tax=Catenulispora sp. GAS73 TaxID=3156269 RepID=UPI003510FC00
MPVPTIGHQPATDPTGVRGASPAKAIGRAAAAAVGLTIAWAVLAGATEHHFAYASLLVGLALARVLTSTPARRAWFPPLAAALAFGVGWCGDVLGVGLDLNWRYDVPLAVVAHRFGELFDNVSGAHSFMDYLFFVLAAVCAAALTAGRQATGADPSARAPRAEQRASDACPDLSATRQP